MKRSESAEILEGIGLNEDQTEGLLKTIEDCTFPRSKRSDPFADAFEDALNLMHRFLTDDLIEHKDTWEDECDPCEVKVALQWPSFLTTKVREFLIHSLMPLAFFCESSLNENQRTSLLIAVYDLYRPGMFMGSVLAISESERDVHKLYESFLWITSSLVISAIKHGSVINLSHNSKKDAKVTAS